MQGKFMLQGDEAAEILPVRIFDPTCDGKFIGFIEGMFEIEQSIIIRVDSAEVLLSLQKQWPGAVS